MKTCTRCKQQKPLDDFHRLTKSSDGRQPKCRPCRAAMADDLYRRKFPENHALLVKQRRAEADGLKFCYRCETAKALDAFNGNVACSDGVQSYCRPCMSKATLDSMGKKRSYYNAKQLARYHAVEKLKPKTEEIIHRRREVARNYYSRNPQYQTLNYRDEQWLVINHLWTGMKQRSKRRNHPMPNFTKDQFKDWLSKNDFEKMHKTYISAEHDKWVKPSVDRLDNSKPYTFGNIRLVTWRENIDAPRKTKGINQ